MTLFAFGVWRCYLWANSFSPAFFISGGTRLAMCFLSIGRHPAGLILLSLDSPMQEKSMLKRYGVVKRFNSLYMEHRKLRKNHNRYIPVTHISALRETGETNITSQVCPAS